MTVSSVWSKFLQLLNSFFFNEQNEQLMLLTPRVIPFLKNEDLCSEYLMSSDSQDPIKYQILGSNLNNSVFIPHFWESLETTPLTFEFLALVHDFLMIGNSFDPKLQDFLSVFCSSSQLSPIHRLFASKMMLNLVLRGFITDDVLFYIFETCLLNFSKFDDSMLLDVLHFKEFTSSSVPTVESTVEHFASLLSQNEEIFLNFFKFLVDFADYSAFSLMIFILDTVPLSSTFITKFTCVLLSFLLFDPEYEPLVKDLLGVLKVGYLIKNSFLNSIVSQLSLRSKR
ncbi:hypothetical protein GEMRC1_005004 [Eukaryota sp. GEM-RC1]